MLRKNQFNNKLSTLTMLAMIITFISPMNVSAGLSTFVATDSTIELSWTSPGDDGDTGQASVYDIRYSLTPVNENNWDSAEQVSDPPLPAQAGSQEDFIITDLLPDNLYYFGIKTADDAYNWSDLSNVAIGVTLDNIMPGPITDLEASGGEEEDEIAIEWHAPGDNGNSGTATSYIIKTYTEFITDDNWDEASTVENPPDPLEGGTEQEFEIEDLVEGQVYYVAIKTIDEVGNISEISNVDFAIAGPDQNTDVDDPFALLPSKYSLKQNYPNPFNPATNIEFVIPFANDVKLDIYNSLGENVVSVVDDYMSPGYYNIRWNGRDDGGNQLASGVYFYRLLAGEYSEKKKMIMIK